MDIPSALLTPGDVISVHATSRRLAYFRGLREILQNVVLPDWLSLDPEAMEGRLLTLPSREMVQVPFNQQLIVG